MSLDPDHYPYWNTFVAFRDRDLHLGPRHVQPCRL
jgi:hypothetical protein